MSRADDRTWPSEEMDYTTTEATLGEPGTPCKDCGAPSFDGFWCVPCHDAANEELKTMEREREEAGIPPCNWFERILRRFSR